MNYEDTQQEIQLCSQ